MEGNEHIPKSAACGGGAEVIYKVKHVSTRGHHAETRRYAEPES